MYVCLCNGYSETQIQQAAQQGAATAGDAFAMLGSHPRCGRCLSFAQDLVAQARREGPGGGSSS